MGTFHAKHKMNKVNFWRRAYFSLSVNCKIIEAQDTEKIINQHKPNNNTLKQKGGEY